MVIGEDLQSSNPLTPRYTFCHFELWMTKLIKLIPILTVEYPWS